MRSLPFRPLGLALLLAASAAAQEPDPAAMAKEARSLLEQGEYARSLELWTSLIEQHGRHAIVRDGEAHLPAASCLRHLGDPKAAAGLLEGYLQRYPKGAGALAAHVEIFHAYVEAGESKTAQKIGRRILASWPDAPETFAVLRAWLERGWKAPRMKTRYEVLYDWTFDRIDGKEDPELRLAFLDLIEAWHRSEDLVKDGAILYCRAWCHAQAERPGEAIELCERYLKRIPKGSNLDKTRLLLARVLFASEPPQAERAKKLLRAILAEPGSKYREQAEELLRSQIGEPPLEIEKGCPRASGLGQVVLLTNLPAGNELRKGAEAWRRAREAQVVPFRGSDVRTAASKLQSLGAEFVAVLVEPSTLDSNFHLDVLELCRDLDADAMPDFHLGYLTARSGDDLEAFLGRILAKEAARGKRARIVTLPFTGADIRELDLFLHFGHGTPRGIVNGISAAQVAGLELPSHPVIVSGACFNAVCSRSFETSLMKRVFLEPVVHSPGDVISLAWIHAGASGFIAALDGDRGEMALAEWERLLSSAPPLGEVVAEDYRLVSMSLRTGHKAFPRYTPGTGKRTSFFDVMLRGLTSRILLSDPSYRPLEEPLQPALLRSEARRAGDELVVEVEVLRPAQGAFINLLPRRGGLPFREQRVYARLPLPDGVEGMLGKPRVELGGSAAGIELTRQAVRQEVWGGKRYMNVQAESASGKLAAKGAVVKLVFPVENARRR